MTRMWIDLWPRDTLFFRSARYFGGMDSISATGDADLLPNPSVVFGMLRQCLWESHRGPESWETYRSAWEHPQSADLLSRLLGPPVPPLRSGTGARTPSGPQNLEPGECWPEASVRMRGVLPCCRMSEDCVRPLFPMPLFVKVLKDENPRENVDHLTLARPVPIDRSRQAFGCAEGPSELNPVLPEDCGLSWENCGAFLRKEAYVDLLKWRPPRDPRLIFLPGDMAAEESRTGIFRNRETLSVKEGGLYSFVQHRWREDFLLKALFEVPGFEQDPGNPELSGPNLGLRPGNRRMGGKGHSVWIDFAADSNEDWLSADERADVLHEIRSANRWYLTLATPAVFENGWGPSWIRRIPGQGWQALPDGLPAGELLGAACGKPQRYSGWDLAQRRPKPFRALAASGTTWFFEFPSGREPENFAQFFERRQGSCISDRDSHAGYGLCFIGAWRPF